MIAGCENNYSVTIDGFDTEYRICKEHFKAWGYYLAGAEKDITLEPHTLKWNETVYSFLVYCAAKIEKDSQLCTAVNEIPTHWP